MTKEAATVLQARSELSTQALVAQGTRAGRDTQVKGCPEHLEGSRVPLDLQSLAGVLLPRKEVWKKC